MRVLFTDASEWLDELTKDNRFVDSSIVRVTVRRSRDAPRHMATLTVLATAIIRGKLVCLECCVGAGLYSLEGPTSGLERVQADAVLLAESIQEKASALGMDVRGGWFMEDDGKGT